MAYVSIADQATNHEPTLAEWNIAIANLEDHNTRLAALEANVPTGITPAFVSMDAVEALYKPVSADWNQMNDNADDIEARIDGLEVLFPTGLSDNYTSVANRANSYVPPVTEWNLMNDNADDHETRLLALEQILSGLVYGFRADFLVTKDGSNLVSNWGNFGSGADVVQATAGNKPLWVASAIGGKNALQFDGVNDALVTAAAEAHLANLPGLSVFVVFQKDTGKTLVTTFSWLNGSAVGVSEISNTPLGADALVSGVKDEAVFYDAVHTLTTPYYDAFVFDGLQTGFPNTYKYYLLGTLKSQTSTSGSAQDLTANISEKFYIGNWRFSPAMGGAGDDASFKGYIASLHIYPLVTSTTRRQAIEAYLAAYYGL